MFGRFEGVLVENLTDSKLEEAIDETRVAMEIREMALDGNVAEDNKFLELDCLMDQLCDEWEFRNTEQAA